MLCLNGESALKRLQMDFFEWDKKGDGITTPKHAEMKKERVNEPFDGLF
jgi:hypothetical protein